MSVVRNAALTNLGSRGFTTVTLDGLAPPLALTTVGRYLGIEVDDALR
jgi:hypothetical protein